MVEKIYPYLFLFTQVTLLGGNHNYSELRCFQVLTMLSFDLICISFKVLIVMSAAGA